MSNAFFSCCLVALLSAGALAQPTKTDFDRWERIKQLRGDARPAMAAAIALVEEDIATREALPLCLAALRHQAADLRAGAANALLAISLRVEEAHRVAAALLDHPDGVIRRRIAPALLRSPEDGARASAVLIAALRDPDASERLHAARALAERSYPRRTIGLALAQAVTDADPVVGRAALRGLERMPSADIPIAALERELESPDQDVTRRAAAALLVLDAGHVRARTVLETAMEREQDAWAASKLVHAGDAALASHLAVLQARRSNAARVDRWRELQEAIKRNLKTFASEAPSKVVPALVSLLEEADAANAHGALLEVLASAGPLAKHALPAIVRAVLRSPGENRYQASLAFTSIDATAAALALVARVDEADQSAVAVRALGLLAEMGADAKPAARVLRAAWRAAQRDRRRRLGVVLVRIDAAGSLPAVSELLASDDVQTRWLGAHAVASAGPRAVTIIPAVLVALAERMSGTVHNLIRALGAMGPAARSTVPYLIRLAREAPYRQDAIEALARIGGADARKEIVRTLENTRDGPLQRSALSALGTVGNVDDVDRILVYVRDRRPERSNDDARLRGTALTALARLRAHADRVVPAVIAFAQDYRPRGGLVQIYTLIAAFDTLAAFGPEATSAVPILLAHLEHRDESIRLAAVKTLAAIRARAPAVRAALKVSATTDNRRIRLAARRALRKLDG